MMDMKAVDCVLGFERAYAAEYLEHMAQLAIVVMAAEEVCSEKLWYNL